MSWPRKGPCPRTFAFSTIAARFVPLLWLATLTLTSVSPGIEPASISPVIANGGAELTMVLPVAFPEARQKLSAGILTFLKSSYGVSELSPQLWNVSPTVKASETRSTQTKHRTFTAKLNAPRGIAREYLFNLTEKDVSKEGTEAKDSKSGTLDIVITGPKYVYQTAADASYEANGQGLENALGLEIKLSPDILQATKSKLVLKFTPLKPGALQNIFEAATGSTDRKISERHLLAGILLWAQAAVRNFKWE